MAADIPTRRVTAIKGQVYPRNGGSEHELAGDLNGTPHGSVT